MEDSEGTTQITYPEQNLEIVNSDFLTIVWNKKEYKTNLVGNYNIENVALAVAVGKYFNIETNDALLAICDYILLSKRSQFVTKNGVNFIVDCYNANPTSMKLSLESFVKSEKKPKGIILGDMLELGEYTDSEHKKITKYVFKQNLECIVFVGKKFKKALADSTEKYTWFPDSESGKLWFATQNFDGFTFLLKGSRGMKIEKVLENQTN